MRDVASDFAAAADAVVGAEDGAGVPLPQPFLPSMQSPRLIAGALSWRALAPHGRRFPLASLVMRQGRPPSREQLGMPSAAGVGAAFRRGVR